MNIVFWSPLSGHGATTSNMTCTALMASLVYRYKTVSFQSGYGNNYLDQSFLGKNSRQIEDCVQEEFAYYGNKGIDSVLSSFTFSSSVQESVRDYSVEVMKGLNYYLPSTRRSNEEVFNERMAEGFQQLLGVCEQHFDLTFIDHQNANPNISDSVFQHADLCVINLNQNPELIHYARERFSQLQCSCKVMYVIGRYDEGNHYTAGHVARLFRIPRTDLGVIPYNSEFMEAILSGQTQEFLKAHCECGKKEDHYYFMKEVRETMEKILRKTGVLYA